MHNILINVTLTPFPVYATQKSLCDQFIRQMSLRLI